MNIEREREREREKPLKRHNIRKRRVEYRFADGRKKTRSRNSDRAKEERVERKKKKKMF